MRSSVRMVLWVGSSVLLAGTALAAELTGPEIKALLYGKTVYLETIHEWADRDIILILYDGRVVGRPQEPALCSKERKQALVVDVEPKRLRCGVEVGTVDENCDSLARIELHDIDLCS